MGVSNEEIDFNNRNNSGNLDEVFYNLKVETIIRPFESESDLDELESNLDEPDKLLITNVKLSKSFVVSTLGLYDDRELPKMLSILKVPVIRKERNKVQDYLMTQYAQLFDNNQIKYEHTQLGWFNHEGADLYLLQHNEINGKVSECDRKNFKFKKGKAQVYFDFLDKHVFPHNNLSLAIIIGLSAVVVSRLREETGVDSIICNFSGQSTTGKTTAAKLIASLFATPTRNGLLFKFNATNNALTKRLIGINGLPMIIDDILVNEKLDISELIYSFADGSGKDRCTSNGEIKDDGDNSFSGTIVLTSEYPILDRGNNNQGLLVRALAMNDIQWTPNADTAELIERKVKNNYGWIGEEFAKYIQTIPLEDLFEKYLQAKQKLDSLMPNWGGFTSRLEKQYAILYLTVALVNDCFNKKLNADELIKIALNSQHASLISHNNSDRALEAIKCFVLQHKQNFTTTKYKVTYPNSGDYYGAIKIDCLDNVEVYIMTEIANSVITKAGIRDSISVKRDWKANGIIKADVGRYDKHYAKSPIKNKWYMHFIFTDNNPLEEIFEESPFNTYEQLTIDEQPLILSNHMPLITLSSLNENLTTKMRLECFTPTLPLLPRHTEDNSDKITLK